MGENELKKAKKSVLTAFIIVVILAALLAAWGIRFRYWHSFSTQKWLDHPDRRAGMTADLFQDYELAGMSKAQVEALLGPDDSARGYFTRPGRSVYWLGERRTIIDSEWLLIDFENGIVTAYEITTD